MKNVPLNRLRKAVFTGTRKQSITLFYLSWEPALAVTHESTRSLDFGVTNKFCPEGELTNTEPANDEGQLYLRN